MTPVQVLVINIAGATQRMEAVARQLADLRLPHERIEAVTPATLSPGPDDPVWYRWERPLRDTEKAACASHIRAWSRVRDLDHPCLILEDDAILSGAVPDLLRALEGMGPDIEHVSLETRGRKKLVARKGHPVLPIRRMYLDRTGAAAYVLFPAGARRLLARADRSRGLADAMIATTYDLKSWQADPALALQRDMAAHYGLRAEGPKRSQIDAEDKPPREGLRFALRRIAAQLRMALRQVPPGRVRRDIDLDPSILTRMS
jgi:glycosyl transferase family 25